MAGKGFKGDIPAADNTHQFPVFDYRNTADGPVYKALTDIGKVVIDIKSNDFRSSPNGTMRQVKNEAIEKVSACVLESG
jgi:hypothetical protein